MANTPLAHVPGSSQPAGTKQPLHTLLVDSNGDPVSVGGGTQYTEDAAAAANPVGTAVNLIRSDTPATLVSADGDNVAQRGTNYGAAYTQIVSSTGSFIDTFGGGTQYTEGDTDASISGTAMLWEDAADTLRAVSAAKPLPVGDAGGSLTVDNAALSVTGGGVEATALRVTVASDSTGVLSVDDNGSSLTVDNAALSVTGGGVEASALRVTIASDSTGVLSVDDNGASLTVDVGTALPAGTNAIGKLAANSGVDIGDVDVTSIAAGTNVIGKVGIDQTTVGTTESVTVKSKTIYQRVVYGTAQTVFNLATDIAAGAFSSAGTDFTNNDATIGAALYADAMIEMPDWAAAPVAGTTVQLWGLLINVDGTDDDTDAPASAAPGGARFLGSWVIAAVDALQRRTITISLAGIQSGFTPYIYNGTAQNMNNDAGTNMVVKITPWTVAQVG